MQYDLVIFHMSRQREWDQGVRNRNFFLFEELKRSPHICKILSVNVLPHSFRRVAQTWIDETRPRLKRVRKGEREIHVSSVVPWLSESLFLSHLRQLLKDEGFSNILLWSYLPTHVQMFHDVPHSYSVFDAVDDWSVHPAYRRVASRIRRNYGTIARTADAVFTVSSGLRQRFTENKNVHWIPNGVDIDRFSNVPAQKAERPTLVYVGVIQNRVDLGLLAHIAHKRPQYDILVAGPVLRGTDVSLLRKLPNVSLRGFVPAPQVPAVLASAHVGIVPHKTMELVESMNPMKVYEYLAAGLPVVSTPLPDMDEFTAGVTQTTTPEAFLAAVDRAIVSTTDVHVLRDLVSHNTWHARFRDMWKVIEGHFD